MMKYRLRSAAAGLVVATVLLATTDQVRAFTVPSSSVLASSFASRLISSNNVKIIRHAACSPTRLPMIADVASVSNEESPKERLFEGLGKGVIRDYKARLPLFASDIKDGLNVQVSIAC